MYFMLKGDWSLLTNIYLNDGRSIKILLFYFKMIIRVIKMVLGICDIYYFFFFDTFLVSLAKSIEKVSNII